MEYCLGNMDQGPRGMTNETVDPMNMRMDSTRRRRGSLERRVKSDCNRVQNAYEGTDQNPAIHLYSRSD